MRYIILLIVAFFLFSGCGSNNNSDNDGNTLARACPDSKNFVNEVQNYGDFLRSECDSVAAALNDPILTAVTREFGSTSIALDRLPYKSDVGQATRKPWSSWWYPKREDTLFRGGDSSPLGKYDIVRKKMYSKQDKPSPNSAADWEQRGYNPAVVAWEGLCDAWALASITTPEPSRGVKVSFTMTSVVFDVEDLKAILLKTFEAVDDTSLKYYGQKFTGSNTSWIYPDIFPEQFHRFVEKQIFEKGEPFIMDHDASHEVWNVPVYKANYTMTALPDDPNAVLVKMWIFTAEPTLANDKNFVGTREAIREYNYVLQGRREGGNLIVTSGYWVRSSNGVDSRRDHPDYLIRIVDPQKLIRKSWNPEIDVEVVDKILEKSF